MSPELDQQLVNKYPLLFKNRNASSEESTMHYGFACGDGWYHIIHNLCACIMSPYNRTLTEVDNATKFRGSSPMWTEDKLQQSKEKLEHELSKIPVVEQVKEKFGTLRFYVSNGNERVYSLIQFAESMTETTCEECGAPGKLCGRGWVRTLCEEHEKILYGNELQKKINKGLD